MNSTYKLYAMMEISIPKLLLNYFIMEVTFLGFTSQDVVAHAGAACAITLAFILRIAREWEKNSLSFKSATIQVACTLSICLLAIYIWHDFLAYRKGFEIYVFFCSLFSVFIVGEIETAFKVGFRRWLKRCLDKIQAIDDKEETK